MENVLAAEVEDIMCDQVIISTELEVFDGDTAQISKTKVQFAAKLFTKSILPVVFSIYYAYLRNQQLLVDKCKNYFIPTLVAFIANSISKSLSSVHRITYPLTAIQKGQTVDTRPTVDEAIDDEKPEKSVECLVLTHPKHITADVIFIHGLHGSLEKTWRQGDWRHDNHQLKKTTIERRMSTGDIDSDRQRNISLKRSCSDIYSCAPNKVSKTQTGGFDREVDFEENMETCGEEARQQQYSKCWPKDWLPLDCPGVRAISLNYTTDPYLWRPVWIKKRNRTSMTERSQEMIDHLLNIGVGEHPIVWVGHSKGGLFVKQIILDAYESNKDSPVKKIYEQTKSMLFYSVPHRGSLLADVTLPLLRRSIELTEIQRNCPFVLELHRKFVEMLEKSETPPEVFSFIETSFTFMSFIYLKIVAFDSCDPGRGYVCGVPLDHREICKPAGRDCFLYRELVRLLKKSETKSD